MKRFIVGSLSVVALSLVTLPAMAEEVSVIKRNLTSNIVEVTPHNLVYHGYQGYFADQGIPSNGAFVRAIKTGKVNPTTLVESAIAKGRLSPETLNDQSYLHAVGVSLRHLDRD